MPAPIVPLYKVEKKPTTKTPKKNTTIIFLHGNSTSNIVWKKQLEASELQAFSMVAYDFPGHGQSIKLKDYSVTNLVKILADNCQKFESVVLVGHSLGGHLAIETLPYLNNCIGCLVFGTPPIKKPINLEEAFLPNDKMSYLFQEELNDFEISEMADLMVKESIEWKKILEKNIKQTDSKFRTAIATSIGNGEFSDEYAILNALQVPVAIFHGEKDVLVNKDYLNQLNISTIWKNEIIEISNSSHSPHIENPVVFNQLLHQYLNNIL